MGLLTCSRRYALRSWDAPSRVSSEEGWWSVAGLAMVVFGGGGGVVPADCTIDAGQYGASVAWRVAEAPVEF
jgi:hypothetical protein